MVTDLIIYDNEFTNFVLSSLRKYIKGNWENEHAQLFIPYEANDFNIYILQQNSLQKVTTILLPEEY